MPRQRNFYLLATTTATVTAAAISVSGQAISSAAAQAVQSGQSVASIPDFSGTWVYPFCCGFSPPLSGPGPVFNKNRRPQSYGADGRLLPAAVRPAAASDLSRYVGDYANPILKPQAADTVKKHGEIELSGLPNPTPRSQCWPEGVPFVLANIGVKLIQQPSSITILYEHDHQFRHVRMNSSHPAQVTPSWYGDSVGHYDGDTLVIDTVGIKIGPFSMIDWF
jgi:hypothetical protein